MANNLLKLRTARGWTQDAAAAAMGTTRTQYVKLENGSRRLSDKWIDRAASAFGVDPGEIVRSQFATPPVVGEIDRQGLVTFFRWPPASDETVALRLLDGSALDSWVFIVDRYGGEGNALVEFGRLALISLKDGRSFLGRLTKSSGSALLSHLQLINGITLPDVDVESTTVVNACSYAARK